MTLEKTRALATYSICALAVVLTITAVSAEWVLHGIFGAATLIAVAGMVALIITLAIAHHGAAFRYMAVSVLMAQVMALLLASNGYPWQSDIHMAFFAALALSSLLYDSKAIMLGAVLIAVHHLVVGMMASDFVFYGGGSLGRVALHAGIVVVETIALTWMTHNTLNMFAVAEQKSAQAELNAETAQNLAHEITRSNAEYRDRRADTMRQLRTAFEKVVTAAAAGDFSHRVDTRATDEELASLAHSVNALVTTVESGLCETGKVLAALAHTDLTRRMTGTYQGAFGKLQSDTNAVADKLTEIVAELRQTSEGLKASTGEILSGANDLSERTSRQAAAIEKTGTAMDRLATAVALNAERAVDASKVADTVTKTADDGGGVMLQATDAMHRIIASSAKISNIIGLIDDIAFQTNLLALNASVEAARAGDAGKGFAVVAIEVRRLAQSAAKASSDVKVLIEQSAKDVKGGADLLANAAAKLTVMLDAARSSNELMGGIAKESRNQAASIDAINSAVQAMDEMTRHNATLVSEINAALEQSKTRASELDRIVDTFSVEAPPAHRHNAPRYVADGNTALAVDTRSD